MIVDLELLRLGTASVATQQGRQGKIDLQRLTHELRPDPPETATAECSSSDEVAATVRLSVS